MFFSIPSLNKVGDAYRGFRVTRQIDVVEIGCTLRELRHEASGAEIVHLGNDDPENVFCLFFRTVPTTSNGVAHVLEHTVLCGSEKFPVKDPFFSMHRRSLNTFMNAFTAPDFTCYPAASQVPKDFYNLLDVYLDAVFHPKLRRLSFLQEGHRLEFQEPENPHSLLERKGVVYNEMKGALNSATSRLSEALHRNAFPDLTYGINSGGDPKVIPQLTYEELRAFHEHHYHPSRCLYYFYGNLPLESHLDFLLEHGVDKVAKTDPLPLFPRQKKLAQPVYERLSYPTSPAEESVDEALVGMLWLTCPILNQEEVLALEILVLALMDNDASPLKKALLKSGLCKQAAASLDIEMSEVPYTMVMKGCKEETSNQLEPLIRQTLQDLVTHGIPRSLIENAMHQLEIDRCEITGDSAPHGLTLFFRAVPLRSHGGQPEDGLKIHEHFEILRQKWDQEPDYFTTLISKYLLNNRHYTQVLLVPDKELAQREEQQEREVLEALRKTLTDTDVQDIIHTSRELAVFQKEQEKQSKEVLPKVTLQDVSRVCRFLPLTNHQVDQLKVYHHGCFTNGLVYVDLVYPLPKVAPEELPLLRLLVSLLSQVGCGGRSYAENLEFIQEHTGGIGGGLSLNVQAQDPKIYCPCLHIQGKALYRKVDKLFLLLKEMSESLNVGDVSRLKECIHKAFTHLHDTLKSHALKYASYLSASVLNEPCCLIQKWFGLDYYWFLRDLAKHLDKRVSHVADSLHDLQQRLLGTQGAHLVISCDDGLYTQLEANRYYGLSQVARKTALPWRLDLPLPSLQSEGRIIASPVAFTSKVLSTVPYEHPASPLLSLAVFLFNNKTLHPIIRERGGAYGGGATCNPINGTMTFYSYRDPHIFSTLTAFDEAARLVAAGHFDFEDVEEAQLEIIQDFDAPIPPGSRAEVAYSWLREGKTPEARQLFRDRVLKATPEKIKQAVEEHVLPQLTQAIPIAFAGKDLLKKENQHLQEKGLPPLTLHAV